MGLREIVGFIEKSDLERQLAVVVHTKETVEDNGFFDFGFSDRIFHAWVIPYSKKSGFKARDIKHHQLCLTCLEYPDQLPYIDLKPGDLVRSELLGMSLLTEADLAKVNIDTSKVSSEFQDWRRTNDPKVLQITERR